MEFPALQYGSHSEIPEGAIRLSEEEALEMQFKTMANWKPQSDIWPLKYGSFILAGSAIAMGMHINFTFRHFLKLKKYARFSTYLPTTILPAIVVVGTHNFAVTNDIILFKTPCPVCVETRATAWQVLCGIFYPVVLSSLSTLSFAAKYKTFFVPHLYYNPHDFFHLMKTVTKRMTPMSYFLIAFNVGAATVITHLEMKTAIKMRMKLVD